MSFSAASRLPFSNSRRTRAYSSSAEICGESCAVFWQPHNKKQNGRSAVKNLTGTDRKSTRLNSSHSQISYAVFCLKKKIETDCLAVVGHCTHVVAPVRIRYAALPIRTRQLRIESHCLIIVGYHAPIDPPHRIWSHT